MCTFLENLISNFNSEMFEITEKLDLKIIPEILVDHLSNFKVPFLHPADVKWPLVFENLFPRGGPGKANLGNYYRCANKSEIDGHFDILFNEISARAVIECKNWTNELPIKEYFKIIEKTIKFDKNTKLQFTITQSMSKIDSADVWSDHLNELGNSNGNKINFLTIEALPEGEFGFKLVPASSKIRIHSDPTMTAIIFNLKIIWQKFKELNKEF